jgi:murein DD-endopeptidase MepM/ murein hydrolase activator NlpD
MEQLKRLRARIEALFPERHLYVRQGGRMHSLVLSQKKQMLMAGGLAAAGLWMGVCTAAMLIDVVQATTSSAQARPVAATVARRTDAGPSPAALAALAERRHAELALLLAEVKGAPGAAEALTPSIARALAAAAVTTDPVGRLRTVQAGQDQVLEAADAFARGRALRLRTALRLAGVASPPAAGASAPGEIQLTAAHDPQAFAAALGVDRNFAERVQQAAADLSEAQALSERADRLPLARPTRGAEETSGFGMRADPFTGRSAFHPGLDFAGARLSPVYATAPGVVAFTGQRTGYGQTVEVDHGGGYRTRYAHLARIAVHPGQHVAAGAQLGGMGSTGRSTGTHLHYEVWVNGRAQNPERFVRAGAYVLQAGHGAG